MRRSRLLWMFSVLCIVLCLVGSRAARAGERWLPVDQDGWTDVSPSADSRVIYVSSSQGDDSNDGLSESTPKKSVQAGLGLLRDGYPDWLCLKRGDVWTWDTANGSYAAIDLGISGRSASEPMVITSYGSSGPRPLIESGPNRGFKMNGGSYKAVIGIEFYAHTRDPDNPDYAGTSGKEGFRLGGTGTNLLLEDCKFSYYVSAGVCLGQAERANFIDDIVIRRNVLVDSYSTDSHSQGIFTDKIDGELIEENVLDHCGWHDTISGAEPTIFNHALYIQCQQDGKDPMGCYDVTIRKNILTRPSSHGCQLRPGGEFEDNLLVRCPLAAFAGGGANNRSTSYMTGNVVLESADITTDLPRGTGLQLQRAIDLTVAEYNIVANKTDSVLGNGVAIGTVSHSDANYRVRYNTVYDWYRANWNKGKAGIEIGESYSTVEVGNNVVQDNEWSCRMVDHLGSTLGDISFAKDVYHSIRDTNKWFMIGTTEYSHSDWVSQTGETGSQSVQVTFKDPTRSCASYNASLGGTASFEAFIGECRQQSKHYWRDEYSCDAVLDYIREGFRPTVDLGSEQVGAVWPPETGDAPTANDDSYSTDEDTTLNVSAPGVLDNDTDPNQDPLTAIKVSDPSHGSVTLNSDGSFEYIPDGDYNGSDSFTYKANDGSSDSNTATVSITVNAINDAPVASNDSYGTEQDTQLNVSSPGVLDNDSDVDGDTLTAIKVSDPSNGSVSLNSDGSFTYTPDAGWTGDDSFTYKANDGTVDSGTATVSINVYEANDAPTANDDSYSTDEDTELNVGAPGVLDNDSDPESDPLTAVLVTDVSNGTLTLNSNGSFDYSPDADYSGSDSFTYKANDGYSDSNTATVSLTVNAVNDAPVASDDSYSTDQDTDLNVGAPGVLDNDTDADGDGLTASLVTDVSHGTLTLNSNGSFDYSPDSGWTGDDSFSYEANDGTVDSNTATVTITVQEPVTADIFVDDDYDSNTPGWQTDHFDCVQDGIDAASDGDVIVVYGGTYVENVDFSGKDITVQSEDPDDSSVVAATVIDGGGSGSVVTFDSGEPTSATLAGFTIQNGTGTSIGGTPRGGGVLCNGGAGTIRKNVISGTTATNGYGAGIYVSSGSTEVKIEHNIIENTSSDNRGGALGVLNSSAVTLVGNLVTGNSANDGAGMWANNSTVTLTNDTFSGNSGGSNGGAVFCKGGASVTFTNCVLWGDTASSGAEIYLREDSTVSVNYSDVEGGESGVAVDGGTLNWNAGNLDSDPLFVDATNDDYHIDSGSPCIDAADGDAAPSQDLDGNSRVDDPNTTNTGTGTPDYADIGAYEYQTAANQAPTASDDSYSTDEDTTLNVSAPGVLDNDTDPEGDPLTAVLVSDVSNGSLTLNSDGSFDYTPDADYNGSDSFTYKANDGTSDSNTATVNLTVNSVNDAPVASDDAYSTDEDTDLNVSAPGVLDNDSDVDGDSLTAVLVADVTNGTLTLNSDGSFDYTPDADYNGSDSFTYKANDGTNDSNTATVSLTVNAVNDAPVASDDSYNTDEDTDLNVSAPGVLDNDTDADGDSLSAVLVSDVTNGTLTLNSDGSFDYTPDADYNGADSFTYKANDGTSDSNTATVNLTVNSVNDAPVASDDAYSTDEDTDLNVSAPGVLDNDSDVDGDGLSAVLVTDVSNGSLTLNSDGSFDYSPDAGFSGDDSFTYKANDGTADSGTATVTITVVAPGVIEVDDDYDSGTPGWGVDHFAAIQGGIDAASSGDTVLVHPGTYTENVDLSGKNITLKSEDPDDSSVVAVTVIDGGAAGQVVSVINGETNSAVVEGFTIQNGSATDGGGVYVNGASPVIRKNVITGNVTTGDGAGVHVYGGSADVVANVIHNNDATNQNGGGIWYEQGSGSIENNLVYENHAWWNGGGIYCWNSSPTLANNTVTDNSAENTSGGGLRCHTDASVTMTNCLLWGNTASNGAQIAIANNSTLSVSYSDVEGGEAGVDVSSSTLNWNAGNIDSDPQFVDAANDDYHIGSGGPCIDAADGDAAPATDLDGNGRFDHPSVTDTGTGTPTYADIGAYEYQNQAPSAADDVYSTDEETELNVSAPGVLDNDSDPEGGSLSASLVSDVSDGALTLNSDGSFDYTPDAGFTGDDSFTYEASDGSLDSNTVTVTITVNPVVTADIYVDDDYDSGTPGWQSDHFDSVQDGIDAASSGDVVLVYAGTYTENISVSGKDITLTSEDPDDGSVVDATILDGGSSGSVVTFEDGTSSGAVIEGFTIQNGAGTSLGGVERGGGVYVNWDSGVTIRKNVVTGNSTPGGYGAGIYVHQSGSTVDILANTIQGNSSDSRGGGVALLGCSSVTVENNLIIENTANDGAGIWNNASTLTAANNTFSGNSATADGGALFCKDSASVTMTNCVLWDDSAASGGPEVHIRGSSTLTATYSDVEGGESGIDVDDSTLNWNAGNLNSDPLFQDAANDNYWLSSGSPCIDAADGDAAPDADLEGDARYDDPNTTNTGTGTPDYADIGCYEYQGGGQVGTKSTGFEPLLATSEDSRSADSGSGADSGSTLDAGTSDTAAPRISITGPSGTVSDSLAVVSGTAEDASRVRGVWVNGVRAVATGANYATWQAAVPLSQGRSADDPDARNTLTVGAADAAGNYAETTATVVSVGEAGRVRKVSLDTVYRGCVVEGDVDTFQFEATAGTSVSITLDGAGSLELRDPWGETIKLDGESLTLAATGLYTVRVLPEGEGSYELSIDGSVPRSVVRTSATLSGPSDEDAYAVSSVAGGVLSARATGEFSPAHIAVLDPAGRTVAEADGLLRGLTLPVTGDYSVVVSGPAGEYDLVCSVTPPQPEEQRLQGAALLRVEAAGGLIELTVAGAEDNAADNVVLIGGTAVEPEGGSLSGGRGLLRARVPADGPAGESEVSFIAHGEQSQNATVQVAP